MLLVYSVLWALCGLLIYGWTIADFSREYPGQYRKWDDRYQLRALALFLALVGPIGVVTGLLVCAFRHGWTLRIKD
jgi:hypothetical protein